MVQSTRESNPSEEILGPFFCLFCVDSGCQQRKLHVFEGCENWDQVVELEDEPDLMPSHPCQFTVSHLAGVTSFEEYLA